MQKALHFTGHFLVEGTAGSSVLNKISDRNTSDPKNSDHLNGTDKQKQSKGIKSFESNYGKGNVFDVMDTDDLLQNKTNKIKLHRRWNILKVDDSETIYNFFFFCILSYFIILCIYLLLCDATDKICSLDSIFVTVHCNRDFLQ